MSKLPPLLLVHGLGDTSRAFKSMTAYLTERGWTVFSCDLKPNNGQLPLEALARQLDRYIQAHLPAAEPFDLLGFSMGGLISRYYLQRMGGLERVRRFLAISSPHRGTWVGYLRWNPGCEQMRPDSEFLKDLNQDWQVLEQVNFVSLWTPFDLMIVPADSSVMPVGRSLSFPVALHPWMLTDDRVFATIVKVLTEPDRS